MNDNTKFTAFAMRTPRKRSRGRRANDLHAVAYDVPDETSLGAWRNLGSGPFRAGADYDAALTWLQSWQCILEARRTAAEHATVRECQAQLNYLATHFPEMDNIPSASCDLLDCRAAYVATRQRRNELAAGYNSVKDATALDMLEGRIDVELQRLLDRPLTAQERKIVRERLAAQNADDTKDTNLKPA